MTDAPKPPPHAPRQAKFPGRGKIKPHQRNTFQQDAHAKTMKRRAEPLMIARHALRPHTPKKG